MYFKKLEIMGFKSFALRTVLHFEPGITAVVGPNGCGKSNIFDAIRWVLGEQSVKALRGTKMEDVIFNGTDKKEPINFAEVSLTFSNESKILPIDYNEVTVSRRLFRSGESEYLLNKTPVRLKDILELFMGTGIGAEAYSLIEQGKIDLVLSSRPEDRRMVFDEASGITKYKSKKRETMRKLEDTEANLLRINDIVVEVKRQIGSVERQAAKARRYQEKFDRLKDLELKFSTIQLNELKSQISELNKQYEESQSQDHSISSRIHELNGSARLIDEGLSALNSKIELLNSDRLNTVNTVERDNDCIKLNQERIHEIDSRKAEIEANISNLEQRIAGQDQKYAKQKESVDNLSESRINKENELKQIEEKLNSLDAEIKEANQKIRESKDLIFNLNAEKINCQNELSDAVARKDANMKRKHRLEVELNKIKEEKQALEEKVAVVNREREELSSALKTKDEEFNALKSEINDLENKKAGLNFVINELEKEKVSRESQLQFLEDLKVRYENMPSKKVVLALDEILPDDIDLVLARIVERKDPRAFEKAVKDCLNSGTEVSALLCEAKLISSNTEKIKQRLAEIDSLVANHKKEIEALNEELGSLKSSIPDHENRIKEAQIAFANKSSERQAQNDEQKRMNDEISLINIEISETQDDIIGLKNKEAALNQKKEELRQQEEEVNNSVNENQDLIRNNSQAREDCLIEITQLKTEIDSWSSREQDQKDALGMIERSLNDDKESLDLRNKEIAASAERKEELKKDVARLQAEIADLTHKVKLIENNISEESQKRTQLKEDIQKSELEIAGLQDQIENIRNNSRDVQLKLQDKNYKVQGLKERIQQVYKTDLETIAFEDLSSFNIEEAKAEIDQLKQKVESFGNVNLVAIEEFDDLKQRYEFLTKQQQDLIDAKESLLKAIAKINRTTRKMFIETFQKVNAEFKNYFRMLFGGGDAQLLLMDENDVLESGIEIICRPPGKKLQNVLLLSGGEKSLAAIALIFAIFKVRPSPFCVLDEIDAALDESNVGRFSRMVQDFAKTSQFIIITHNKKTIVSANVMYGITMEESGVSKIVSVKLTEDNKKAPKEEPVAV